MTLFVAPFPPRPASSMRLLLLIGPLLLSGCFISRTSVNEPLAPKSLDTLQPGVTTAAEVTALLGAPTEVVQLGRRSAYRFDASTTKEAAFWLVIVAFMNEDSRADRVWVFFDENDVLTHVGGTFNSRDPKYAMPWQDLHEEE